MICVPVSDFVLGPNYISWIVFIYKKIQYIWRQKVLHKTSPYNDARTGAEGYTLKLKMLKHFLLKSLNLELADLSRTPAWHESPLHPSNTRKKWALLRLQTFTSSDQRLSTGQHPQFLHNYNSAILHILLCPLFTLPPVRSPFPSFALLLTTLSPIINRWGNYQQRCCVKNQPKSVHSIS